ncbi:MAG: O-antigen ligase family protein, partial [bacterium]|nr:O-antigen ligase family protein [bacterium]
MTLSKICDSTLEYSFYLLFLLVPLVMTPWNFELFEYNKMMLTYALTVIITAAWATKMIAAKKFLFKRTPFDIPLAIFFVFQFLSFLFSIDRHTSFWGYYSRFHGGLLSTITYLTLYFAFVSNFDKTKTLTAIRYTLVSAFLVSFYGILEHFGIDAKYWVQDVKNRVFSTLGQPNWLAAYLLALIPLPLAFLLNKLNIRSNSQKPNYQLLITNYQFHFYILLFTLIALALFYTKSRSGLYSLIPVAGFFISLLLLPKIFSLKKKILLPCLFFAAAILVVTGIFVLGKFSDQLQSVGYIFGTNNDARIVPQKLGALGSPSSDIRKIVWRGAVDIFKEYPLFGSGIETFAYSYYQFKPIEHNIVSEWDFLYNKAHNEYLNFLATTGAFGLGSYLLLIGWIFLWNVKTLIKTNRERIETNEPMFAHSRKFSDIRVNSHILITALFSGWFSILITNFFGFSVVPVALFFFLFPAFAVVLTKNEEPAPIQKPAQKPYKPEAGNPYLIILIL